MCDKGFTQSGSLTTDKCDLWIYIHPKISYFKYIVWYEFIDSVSLTKHKGSCAGTKWFKCDLCDKGFIENKQRQLVWKGFL